MSLKAVIFDFDGVVADSEPLHYEALNAIFKRYGVEVSWEEHWEKYLGYTDRENIEAVSRDYDLGIGEEDLEGLMADKAKIFESLVSGRDVLISGVGDFVRRVFDAGLAVAICSGAILADIEIMLRFSGIRDFFELIVAADDVPHGKPDPGGYLLALSRLNEGRSDRIEAGECVVIEDSRWGLEAAQRAGMHRVAVTNTYSSRELDGQAELIVDDLGSLSIERLAGVAD